MFGLLGRASAACAANTANLGSVSGSFTVPTAGNYRVWSRIMPDSTTVSNNSYTLEIDDSTCNITVGDATIPASGWTWVDYQGGNTSSKINLTLSAGTHTYTMYGREAGVQLDRIIFSADSACVPIGTGNNCATTADTTNPTVNLAAPANNTTVSSGSVAITASASDDVEVDKVEFYLGSNLLGTDNASPYSFTLNTTLYPNGNYSLTSKAYDSSDNTATSVAVSITINNVILDTTPPSVILTAPFNNTTISGTYTVSATAADAVGVTKVDFSVDGGAVALSDTTSPYSYLLNTATLTNGSHIIRATAYDDANNSNAASATVTVNNTSPAPKKADFNGDTKVDLNDLFILLGSFNKATPANTKGDCNGDAKVDINDLFILLGLFGK